MPTVSPDPSDRQNPAPRAEVVYVAVTTPAELAASDVSLADLVAAWVAHVLLLVRRPAAPMGRLRSAALDALTTGEAAIVRLSAARWSTVVDALTHGATLDRVAFAMGLTEVEVRAGLTSWADGLHPLARPGVLALLDGPAAR